MVFSYRPPKKRKEIKLFTRESSQQAKEEREIFLGFSFFLITTTIFLVFSYGLSNTQEEN